MTKQAAQDKARKQLDNLADAMVEDIMSLTEEELLAEMYEDGQDPDEIAARGRKIIERCFARPDRSGGEK